MQRVLGLITLLAFCAVPAPALADHPGETGTLGIVHKDGFGKGPSEFDYTLKQGDRTLDVLPTQLGAVGHGDRVRVQGREEDGTVVGKVAGAGPSAAAWLGERNLGVVLVNWTGDQREPWTPAQVRDAIFDGSGSMNAFYEEETYDQISFAGDVLGWYTIDAPSTGCDSQWNNWTNLVLQAAGDDLNEYQHLMFVFPPTDCGWAGLGHVGGPYSWINGTLDTRVTAHEIGHNLGLHHANGYTCTSGGTPVTYSDTCTSMEYGDPFDVMGSSSRHNHGWHLQRLGVLAPSNVQTITESGSYTMRSVIAQTSEPTTLRIPRTRAPNGSVLDWYYLEVRPGGGVFDYFHPLDPGRGGVHIRVNDNPSVTTQSRLLDSKPGTGWMHSDAPFQPGSSFTDGSVAVHVTDVSGDEATVAIALPDQPDTQAPSVPTGLGAAATAKGANLHWTASRDNLAVTSYAVYRDGVQIGTSASPSYSDKGAAPGARAYAVAAEDAAHNRSGLSAPAVVTVPAPKKKGSEPRPGRRPHPYRGKRPAADSRAPSIRVRRQRRRRGRVSIQVRAADAGGLASVELFIAGKRRKSVRLSSSNSVATLRFAGRIRRGVRSAVVRATDRAGNTSRITFRLKR